LKTGRFIRGCAGLLVAASALVMPGTEALGYVEAPFTLGRVTNESTNVLVMRVEKVDREKNLIVYRKVRDIKGTHPGETIKHNIGTRGFHPREWQNIMKWAQAGKLAVLFHNGGHGETCIDNYWYQAVGREWWSMTHAEPYFLRSFAGRPAKLATLVERMLAGEEVAVPCMVDGDKNALQLRTARVQRIKASLKIADYDPKRDFVGWGVEEFVAVGDMPGFTHYAAVANVGPGAAGVASTDIDGDGRADFCLFGAGGLTLLQSADESFNDVHVPVRGGVRGAAWADFNGDGKEDLLLATTSGPRLLENDGRKLRDITASMPVRGYYNLKAAAWLDYDGDKRPDVLLADGFRGLRLYRNLRAPAALDPNEPRTGAWYYIGPFDNTSRRGFNTIYPPEKEIDLSKQYPGKEGAKAAWKEAKFTDGKVNGLALFKSGRHNRRVVVYVYRVLDFGRALDLPISLGSDDTLTVWLNGEKVLSQNVERSCRPDQAKLALKLKCGRNGLLMKICNNSGEPRFYFAANREVPSAPRLFEDVSKAAGLGPHGVGGKLKGDRLAVADVNGDKRPDFLYSAGTGVLAVNTPGGFLRAKSSGVSYRAGGVSPAFGDMDGDGDVDLFVPQTGRCKLFRNDGRGRFTDVTPSAGALAGPIGRATCAVWADFNNHGRLDLLVGCLKGPNRYFRNDGAGKFSDAGEEIGLYRRIFNTRGISVLDLNKDGTMDVVFNNEGQKSAVLLGNPLRRAAVAVRDK